MKKTISFILSVAILSAFGITAYCSPTIDYVFNSDEYSYVFGTVNSAKITDMGLKVSNKDHETEIIRFSEVDPTKINGVNTHAKYGFGINPNGMLSESFSVKPFYDTAEGTFPGASYIINPSKGRITKVDGGETLAAADCLISGKTGNTSSTGPAEIHTPISNHAGLPSSTATYTNIAFYRFNLSDIDTDAFDIILQLGSYAGNSGIIKVLNNEDLKITIRAVEHATEDWSDAPENFNGYSTVTGGKRTNANLVTDVSDNDDAIIATITDFDLQGKVLDYNGATSSSGFVYFYADVTEYVKKAEADGKKSVTFAIKGDNIGTTLYIYTKEYTSNPSRFNQRTYLTWK